MSDAQKPNLTVHSGGNSSTNSSLSARVEPLDFANYPKGKLKYFTNAVEEFKGTALALNPEIVASIFVVSKTNYTGIYSKEGMTWIVAENFEYVIEKLQHI